MISLKCIVNIQTIKFLESAHIEAMIIMKIWEVIDLNHNHKENNIIHNKNIIVLNIIMNNFNKLIVHWKNNWMISKIK
jgi:hypothetical protein